LSKLEADIMSSVLLSFSFGAKIAPTLLTLYLTLIASYF